MSRDSRYVMPAPPDAYVAGLAVIALLLEAVFPLSLLPDASTTSPLLYLGLLMAASGLAIEILAARTLTAAGAGTGPNAAPTVLTTTGPFLLTRNPFYCGVILLLVGLAMAASLDWAIVLMPMLWLALDRLVVPYEERRLAAAFGEAYEDYQSVTPRWLWH